jgi:hypothetical protein
MRGLVALVVLLVAAPAAAQVMPNDQSLVTFNRYVAVRERRLPGFDSPGIPLASFTLQPSLDANVLYNDNVLATQDDREGDVIARITPALSANSNWSDSLLALSAVADIDRYARLGTENTVNTTLSAYGWHDLSQATRFRTLVRFQSQRESRESQDVFVLTQRPIRFRTLELGVGVRQRFANTQVQAEAGVVKSDFDDAVRRNDGVTVDQDFRDSVLKRGRVRAEFGQSPAFAYFVQGTYDQRTYRLRASDPLASARESETVEGLGGIRFELPVLMRGEVGVGYTRGSYRGAQFNPVSGLALRTEVTFFPTQLTNVVATVERRVSDTGIPASGGYASLSGGVRVDHELLRQLLLGASVNFRRDTFNGVDRNDERFELAAIADYRVNRHLSGRLNFSRLDLTSNGANAYKSFVANRLLFGIGLRP